MNNRVHLPLQSIALTRVPSILPLSPLSLPPRSVSVIDTYVGLPCSTGASYLGILCQCCHLCLQLQQFTLLLLPAYRPLQQNHVTVRPSEEDSPLS